MMTTATERKAHFWPSVLIPAGRDGVPARTRLIAAAAIAGIAASIMVMIVVSLNPGYWFPPDLVTPGGGPPWDFSWVHISVGVATVALWVAALAAGGGVAAGLIAVRRGIRPNPGLLMGAGLVAVLIFTVLRPAGSTDILDYGTFGHLVAIGQSPYVWAPDHLRAAGNSFGSQVPLEWENHVTPYGPLATFEQFLAASLGGSSLAKIVFWLKLWNAIAFATVSVVADRLLRSDPSARLRAHLLWTVNPLLLWGLIEAGHIDMIAAGAGLLGLVFLGTGRRRSSPSPGAAALASVASPTTVSAPSIGRAVVAGLFLGAAADVKIPYIIFAVAAAWSLRRARLPLLTMIGAVLAVLIPTYLWYGPPAVRAVLDRTTKVTADNFYQLFSSPFGFVFRHLFAFSVGSVLVLAVLLLWRLPRVSSPVPGIRVTLAMSCAWLFVWPYQLPWYDAMIICVLIIFPASRLDWIVLGRLAVGTIALIPGDPYLHAGQVIGRVDQDILTLGAPILLLVGVAAVVALCVTGRWRASQTDVPASSSNKPTPVRT
jgi:hypothetical protein